MQNIALVSHTTITDKLSEITMFWLIYFGEFSNSACVAYQLLLFLGALIVLICSFSVSERVPGKKS